VVGRVVSSDVVRARTTPLDTIIVAFVNFSRVFLLGILIFKGLTARRLYKSFGVKGLIYRVKMF
jgi:hypothetical protein